MHMTQIMCFFFVSKVWLVFKLNGYQHVWLRSAYVRCPMHEAIGFQLNFIITTVVFAALFTHVSHGFMLSPLNCV